MAVAPPKAAPPSDDKRWRIVNAAMRRNGFEPSALIETLHAEQEAFGYLEDVGLRYIAQNLSLPLSKVYGVATFYNHFTLKPQGKHTCVVCMGTACYIKGAAQIINAISQQTGIKPGETTPDKSLSLLVARCLGACGMAPAVVYDGDIAGQVEPDGARARVAEWIDDAE